MMNTVGVLVELIMRGQGVRGEWLGGLKDAVVGGGGSARRENRSP